MYTCRVSHCAPDVAAFTQSLDWAAQLQLPVRALLSNTSVFSVLLFIISFRTSTLNLAASRSVPNEALFVRAAEYIIIITIITKRLSLTQRDVDDDDMAMITTLAALCRYHRSSLQETIHSNYHLKLFFAWDLSY